MGDNKPDNFELAMIGLDALIYGLTDYSHNIELLQTIRAQMLTCGYRDSDLEIHVIDELIEEYKNKWGEAIGSALAEIAADTIVTIATKHPALSAVKVASDLAMMLSPIDEKAEWLALSCYRDALKKCIYPVNDLYVNGKITTDKEELKPICITIPTYAVKSTRACI